MTLFDPTPIRPPAQFRSLVGYLIAPVFLLLAVWFVWGPDPNDIPRTEAVTISDDQITTRPVREVLSNAASIIVGGYRLGCMECHKLFESPSESPRRLMQHMDIELNHGLTERCLDCHDKDNRNELALTGGATVPFTDVPRLCGKCHGPTYRDWQRGMHGRTNGYWDQSRGEQRRLSCIECHDPHAPAFDPMQSLPGPNTLRMGDPDRARDGEKGSKRNPLRHWSRGQAEPSASATDKSTPTGAEAQKEHE